MIFSVKYRDSSGAVCEKAVEAADRADCFARCKLNGIAPIGIRVAESGTAAPVRRLSRLNNTGRWLLILSVPILAYALFWLFVQDKPNGDVASDLPAPKQAIKTHAPAVARITLPAVSVPTNNAEMIVLPNGVITNKPKTIADAIKMVRLKPGFHSYKSVDDVFAQTNRFQIGPYKSLNLKSSTEAQLSLIATRPRTMPIPPMPPLPPMMEKDFERAMNNYLVASEGDSDADIAQKKEIELLKDMMRHYVKDEGMSPARALQEVENQHNRAANMYQLYRREYVKLVREDSPDAEAFYGAAINKLRESGAPIFDREANHIQE